MKKNTLKKIISTVFVLSLFFVAFSFLKIDQVKADDTIFGTIEAPAGVDKFNADAGEDANNMGLLLFVSNVIKLISIVGGIFVLFNFVFAGFTYITANGDSSAYSKIGEKLSLSVTGLILIVASYTIAGIIGLIIFGDATYIINPQIPTI